MKNLKSVAEDIRSDIMVSICDISRQSICRELVVMFELEDHELPIVRILFRMSDHSMEKKGQEELFYKFAMDKTGNADQVREIENDANTKSKYIYDSKLMTRNYEN